MSLQDVYLVESLEKNVIEDNLRLLGVVVKATTFFRYRLESSKKQYLKESFIQCYLLYGEETMIKLVNVEAGYSGKRIIKHINCSFECGNITAIIGPNGSGKSTLIKAILGLITRMSGEIFIGEKEIFSIAKKDLAREISYLPQTRDLPSISVEKMILHGRFPYLSYPRVYSKEDMEYVKEAMNKMGIVHLRYKDVSKLSGGERQKVYLAMALVQKSNVLILDEPTTYLDISYQMELMDLLRIFKKEGKTIIVVLHDLNMALQYADSIVVMEKGIIKGVGSPEHIYNNKILDEVFEITCKHFVDETGQSYYFFDRQ